MKIKKLHRQMKREVSPKLKEKLNRDPSYYYSQEINDIIFAIGDVIDWDKKVYDGPAIQSMIDELLVKAVKRGRRLK